MRRYLRDTAVVGFSTCTHIRTRSFSDGGPHIGSSKPYERCTVYEIYVRTDPFFIGSVGGAIAPGPAVSRNTTRTRVAAYVPDKRSAECFTWRPYRHTCTRVYVYGTPFTRPGRLCDTDVWPRRARTAHVCVCVRVRLSLAPCPCRPRGVM